MSQWETAKQDLAAAERRVAEQRERDEEARSAHEAAQRRLRRAEIAENLTALRLPETEALNKTIEAKRQAIAGISIDASDMKKLRDTERQLLEQRAALEAIATRLDFKPDGDKAVSVDDRSYDAANPLRVTDQTMIRLEGFGALEVTPGGEDIGSRRTALATLESRLQGKLQSLGFQMTDEAEEAYRARQEKTEQVKQLTAKLQGIAPDGIDAVRATEQKQREELARVTIDADGEPLPVDRAREIESTAQKKKNESQRALRDIEEVKSAVQARYDLAKERWMAAKTENSIKGKISLHTADEVKEKRCGITDEKLEERVRGARDSYLDRKREHDGLVAELDSCTPDLVKAEQKRALDAYDKFAETVRLDKRAARDLKVELQALGHTGLAEELQRKNGEVALARQEQERVETDAKAWRLLLDTLRAAESEAKAAFLEPVNCRLQPYLQLLFPQTDLRLEEDTLEIAGLHRGGVDEPFSSLSIGAREQIAVITRLALADFLREKGKPVSLILDDPLVNSDDERFRRMEIALRKAAENVQIVILTCHETRYLTLGAKTIRLSDCHAARAPGSRRQDL